MSDDAVSNTCETCEHWERAKSNSGTTLYGWGACSAITVDYAHEDQFPEEKAWMDAWGVHTEGYAVLQTRPDFGCALWTAT